MAVLVRGERIAAIGRATGFNRPGARVIDHAAMLRVDVEDYTPAPSSGNDRYDVGAWPAISPVNRTTVPQATLKRWSLDGIHLSAYWLLVSHPNISERQTLTIRGLACRLSQASGRA